MAVLSDSKTARAKILSSVRSVTSKFLAPGVAFAKVVGDRALQAPSPTYQGQFVATGDLDAMPCFCCRHPIQAVQIGGKTIFAGGAMAIAPYDIRVLNPRLIVALAGNAMPLAFGMRCEILAGPLPDFGGVPFAWKKFVHEVAKEVKRGGTILSYCQGGHGRTGTLLASLIAEMEPKTEDPIAALRERYCLSAVETTPQAEAIFGMRGLAVPESYRGTFEGDIIAARLAERERAAKQK